MIVNEKMDNILWYTLMSLLIIFGVLMTIILGCLALHMTGLKQMNIGDSYGITRQN